MKRNVFKRTKDAISNWYFGVDEEDENNSVFGDSYDDDCCESDRSWGVYALLKTEPDWAEEVEDKTNNFKVGQTVQAVLRSEDAGALYFHMAVFMEQAGINDGFHIAVRRYTDKSHDECFSGVVMVSDTVKPVFDEWMEKYSKFVTDFERALPIIREGDEISGTAVGFAGKLKRDKVPDDTLFKEWLWIVENCDVQVIASHKCWVFSDNSDAVKYKLTNF
jgi:hypothetical protein